VKRWIGFTPLIVLVGLGVLFAGYALKHDPRVQPHALVGKPVPAVVLPDLDTGEMVAVRDKPAGPRLINFYASWCAPCRVEAPAADGAEGPGVRWSGSPTRTSRPAPRLSWPSWATRSPSS
jgi:cytochrome c biogenesis protein CcmG/thiol:disulfide interchange protein DsbE